MSDCAVPPMHELHNNENLSQALIVLQEGIYAAVNFMLLFTLCVFIDSLACAIGQLLPASVPYLPQLCHGN